MSAPGQRVSSRVALGEPPITRKDAVRLSTPQVGFTGAQKPSTSRLYEFTVGQNMGAIPSRLETWPCRKLSKSLEIPPCRPRLSWKRFFEPSERLWCRWPEHPGYCALHLAMKLGMMPNRALSYF